MYLAHFLESWSCCGSYDSVFSPKKALAARCGIVRLAAVSSLGTEIIERSLGKPPALEVDGAENNTGDGTSHNPDRVDAAQGISVPCNPKASACLGRGENATGAKLGDSNP